MISLKSVLIADPVHPSCSRLLLENGIQTTTKLKMTREELLKEIKEHEGVIVRSETKIDEEALRSGGGRLKAVGRAGTGVDNIDTEAATRHGVLVLNTPGGNSISACELTCALIMNLARDVGAACSSLKGGLWERKAWVGTELSGKTLAVVGLGRVGREVANRMASFGMDLIGYDPFPPPPASLPQALHVLPLEQIWPRADYITLHVPLLPSTKGLVGREELMSKCKEGVRLVNCSRGGIVDEEALLEAVQSRGVRAALDVFTEEPPRSDRLLRLLAHPSVIATPHLGASTAEAQERVAVEIAQQFIALSQPDKGFLVDGAVNFPGLRELSSSGGGWSRLGRAMGGLARGGSVAAAAGGARLRGPPHLAPPVLLGLLAGCSSRSSNGVNLVSAPSIAASKGIRLVVETTDGGGPVSLTVHADGGKSHAVTGTVRDGEGYLLSIDEASFSPGARITQNTIFFRTSCPQGDGVKFIGELMKRGMMIKNMSTAQGKAYSWFAIETDQSLSTINIQDFDGVIA